MGKLITTDRVYQALYDAKLISVEPRNVRRCVIDMEVGYPTRIYVETFVDEKLIDVMLGLRVTKPPTDP